MEQTDRRPRGNGKFRPARFASVIVQELAQQIISGALAEGDVLPTEPALCEEFGFSRTVVREGLKLLEERGLVRVEQGRGTTVQPRGSWNLLDPDVLRIALDYDDDMSLLDDLISVRRVLEHFVANRQDGESVRDYVLRYKVETFRAMTNDLAKPADLFPEIYQDWGDNETYSLQLGRGECAA